MPTIDEQRNNLETHWENQGPLALATGLYEQHHEHPERLARLIKDSGVLQHPTPAGISVRRIGIYYPGFGQGGIEGVTLSLVPLFQKLGIEPVLLFDRQPAPERLPELLRTIEIVVIPPLRAGRYEDRAAGWLKTIEQHSIDTVLYHHWSNKDMLWDLLPIKRAGARFVVHCHNLFCNSIIDLTPAFVRHGFVYALADAVIALSEVDALFYSSFCPRVFTAQNTLPPASSAALLQEPADEQNERIVLWMGRIHQSKRLEEAVKVFALAKKESRCPEARLHIAGSTQDELYLSQLHDLIKELGVSDSVVFEGWVQGAEKLRLLQRSWVMLQTSLYEGYPLTLAEAFSQGVPAILYDMPFLTLARGNPAALQVADGDSITAASELKRILEDEEAHRELSRQALEHMRILNTSFDASAFWKEVFVSLESAPPRDTLVDETLRLSYESIMLAYSRALSQQGTREAFLVDSLTQENARLRLIEGSRSYRIGRLLTAPLRAVRKFIRFCAPLR